MTGRILYLALESPREGQASYAHVHEIINGLKRRDWTVDLFTPSFADRWQRPGLLGRLLEYRRVQSALKKSWRPGDIIYMRSHFLAWPLAWWAHRRGIAVAQEINGPYEDVFISYRWMKPFGAIMKAMWSSQYRWAKGLIAVTPQLGDWVQKQTGPRHVAIIPNGANTDLFHPAAKRKIELEEPYVLFFGGLARWQGIPTLLDACAHERWPEGIRLVIVGDGQERGAVEDAAATNPRIDYIGRQEYKTLPGIIAKSIAGLVPKNSLGDRDATGLFPLKIFETLACGVPAVVSDFPGQADLVRDNDCGLVIPAEDPAALADAVAELVANPDSAKAMGERGAKTIAAGHSWDHRAAATAELMDQIQPDQPTG